MPGLTGAGLLEAAESSISRCARASAIMLLEHGSTRNGPFAHLHDPARDADAWHRATWPVPGGLTPTRVGRQVQWVGGLIHR